VLLLALGVAREDIVADFLISNERWVPHDTAADWTVLSRVRAEYLQTAFDAIDAGWVSADAYLAQALGFGPAQRERLAALLLSPPTPAAAARGRTWHPASS
jgi:protein-tyrosine phosphatase